MDTLCSLDAVPVAPDTFALPAYCPVPQLGVLPMTAFVIRGTCPVLIDAGPGPLREAFMRQLENLLDPRDLRFIWVTHTDPDHVGALDAVLEAAPDARVVTTMLGAGKLALQRRIPEHRLHLLSPGDRLNAGDRELVALRPPTYDAPETLAAFDPATRTLFAADSFAATMDAPADEASDLMPARLREGMVAWAGVDMPWLALVDETRFSDTLDQLRRLNPEIVLSSHLPPARRMTGTLLEHLAATAHALARPGVPA